MGSCCGGQPKQASDPGSNPGRSDSFHTNKAYENTEPDESSPSHESTEKQIKSKNKESKKMKQSNKAKNEHKKKSKEQAMTSNANEAGTSFENNSNTTAGFHSHMPVNNRHSTQDHWNAPSPSPHPSDHSCSTNPMNPMFNESKFHESNDSSDHSIDNGCVEGPEVCKPDIPPRSKISTASNKSVPKIPAYTGPTAEYTELDQPVETLDERHIDVIVEEGSREVVSSARHVSASDKGSRSTVQTRNVSAVKKDKKLVVALFDSVVGASSSNYVNGIDTKNLSFKKGDLMEVIEEDGECWLAKSLDDGEKGYIPRNYFAEDKSLESNDWFHGGLSKNEARTLIESKESNRPGTFLVRNAENAPGSFALAVLDGTEAENGILNGEVYEEGRARVVKHYRITFQATDKRYYINRKRMFSSLEELVEEYSRPSEEICFPLLHPCPKPRPGVKHQSIESPDHWEISAEHITKLERVGHGQFGEVWRGLWKGKLEVAVKVMKIETMEKGLFLQEAATMKNLNHKRLIKLYGICSVREPVQIVTEFVKGGSLLNHLKKKENISQIFILKIASQVADGMRYIEQMKYIHRDLAARNVLLDDNEDAKICDFGLSKLLKGDVYLASQSPYVPIRWTAPEGLKERKFDIKSDVWGYGILLVELTTHGGRPYPDLDNKEIIPYLESGKRHPKPESCPSFLFDIMRSCWHQKPALRPSFDEIFTRIERELSLDKT